MPNYNEVKSNLASAFLAAPSQWEPFIEKIVFLKYKRIRDNEFLTFTYPVTALLGRNGSNKSSILHALYGAPANQSPGSFWFSTSLDPIEDATLRPRFFYDFKITAGGRSTTAQVRKMMYQQKKLRSSNGTLIDPDYWEPTPPALRDGMRRFVREDIWADYSSSDRWNPIDKDVIYLDLRVDLSIFDRIYTQIADGRVKAKKAIRRIAKPLRKALEQMAKTRSWHRKERIHSNQEFDVDMIDAVNYVLGQKYTSIKYIDHTFFGARGYTFLFSNITDYSDAFAGRGEASVARIVFRVFTAKPKSLIILDEPETSLHIDAQKKLVQVLINKSLLEKHQVVIATHSPFMAEELPRHAVKLAVPQADGSVVLVDEGSSADTIYHLGGQIPSESLTTIFVEDKLSEYIVKRAIERQLPESTRSQLTVSILTGGASTILSKIMPVHMETDTSNKYYYFLDGDMQTSTMHSQISEYPSSASIPEIENSNLATHIKNLNGLMPKLNVDGNSGEAQSDGKLQAMRKFYDFSLKRVCYLPFENPESCLISMVGSEYKSVIQDTGLDTNKEKLEAIAISRIGDPALIDSNSIHLTLCSLWNSFDVTDIEKEIARLIGNRM